jgi:glycosyltransferase involved in cell wall biosynthesis
VSERTRILFVSHEGTRTGAPMMLLHFLRWVREHASIEPEIALLRGGPLVEEFAELGPTTVLGEVSDWPPPSRAESALSRVRLDGPSFALQKARVRPVVAPLRDERIVYLNSSVSLRLLHHLPKVQTAVAHVHELQSSLPWSMRPQDPALMRTRVSHFVAAADCVADNLVREYGIQPDDVTRIYEFIDTAKVVAPPERDRTDIRAELGLPDDAFVVGGSGYADWRKGIDLFVQMAKAVRLAGRRDIHFVWVGDRPGGFEKDELDVDIVHADVGDQLHLVGLRDRPFDWYRAFDVFALTSREDPYPLVGLETALLEVPMVCFDRSGGMIELVNRSREEGSGESGVIVPYLDVEAMADAVIALVDDPARRAAIGRQAAAVVGRDHRVEVAAPQLLEVLEKVTGRSLS